MLAPGAGNSDLEGNELTGSPSLPTTLRIQIYTRWEGQRCCPGSKERGCTASVDTSVSWQQNGSAAGVWALPTLCSRCLTASGP